MPIKGAGKAHGSDASSSIATYGEMLGAASRPATEAQQLEYVADMIAELKIMALKANSATLVDILGLAHREALREAGRR